MLVMLTITHYTVHKLAMKCSGTHQSVSCWVGSLMGLFFTSPPDLWPLVLGKHATIVVEGFSLTCTWYLPPLYAHTCRYIDDILVKSYNTRVVGTVIVTGCVQINKFITFLARLCIQARFLILFLCNFKYTFYKTKLLQFSIQYFKWINH